MSEADQGSAHTDNPLRVASVRVSAEKHKMFAGERVAVDRQQTETEPNKELKRCEESIVSEILHKQSW